MLHLNFWEVSSNGKTSSSNLENVGSIPTTSANFIGVKMHDLQRKLVRSKVRLMVDKGKNGLGFYASVLYKMPLVIKNEIPTMATDGTNIFYNEEFTDSLTEPELDFV